jgi:hypothetical protein
MHEWRSVGAGGGAAGGMFGAPGWPGRAGFPPVVAPHEARNDGGSCCFRYLLSSPSRLLLLVVVLVHRDEPPRKRQVVGSTPSRSRQRGSLTQGFVDLAGSAPSGSNQTHSVIAVVSGQERTLTGTRS